MPRIPNSAIKLPLRLTELNLWQISSWFPPCPISFIKQIFQFPYNKALYSASWLPFLGVVTLDSFSPYPFEMQNKDPEVTYSRTSKPSLWKANIKKIASISQSLWQVRLLTLISIKRASSHWPHPLQVLLGTLFINLPCHLNTSFLFPWMKKSWPYYKSLQ